ncbi:MAG: hypothetical protein ACM31C_02515 [Acidobacteriota bacterium]
MKKVLMVAALAGVAYGGWHWQHSHHADTESRLLRDRIWVDHMPRNERDMVNVLVVMSEQPVGVFNATSVWKGTYEGFRYEQSGDELRIVFPQTGDRDRVRVRARRCKEQGMDYCLDVEGASRGVKRYYSREGWDIDRQDELRAKLEQIQAAR